MPLQSIMAYRGWWLGWLCGCCVGGALSRWLRSLRSQRSVGDSTKEEPDNNEASEENFTTVAAITTLDGRESFENNEVSAEHLTTTITSPNVRGSFEHNEVPAENFTAALTTLTAPLDVRESFENNGYAMMRGVLGDTKNKLARFVESICSDQQWMVRKISCQSGVEYYRGDELNRLQSVDPKSIDTVERQFIDKFKQFGADPMMRVLEWIDYVIDPYHSNDHTYDMWFGCGKESNAEPLDRYNCVAMFCLNEPFTIDRVVRDNMVCNKHIDRSDGLIVDQQRNNDWLDTQKSNLGPDRMLIIGVCD